MPARGGTPDVTDLDLVEHDATALAARVRARELPARRLIEATLRRIDEVDPTVNAYRAVLGDEALAEADRLDALPDDELAALPLAGVPVAVKDDTDVAGQVTAWGSGVDRGVCERDSDVVRRLRAAGAVIVGKTNVPELTIWPWTASQRWGATRNPWNLDRTPGGSSGGSAAAVTTGMCALALGSDGGGSVRYPAGLTGLVGLKPQRDRLPVGPEHASAWHGLLVLGPLTRIGAGRRAVPRRGLGRLAGHRHAGRDVAALPDHAGLEARTRNVARLARLLPARTLRQALAHEQDIAASINGTFESADVVLTPLCAAPAPRLAACPTTGATRSLRASNTSAWLVPWNVTGQPAITVPVGVAGVNLPTAVHLAGRPHDEPTLLALAAQVERARPFPRWTPTITRATDPRH